MWFRSRSQNRRRSKRKRSCICENEIPVTLRQLAQKLDLFDSDRVDPSTSCDIRDFVARVCWQREPNDFALTLYNQGIDVFTAELLTRNFFDVGIWDHAK